MAASKRTRFEVLKRDNYTCRYCGGAAPDVTLTVDHVTPIALGGSDDPSNLVAACKDCNAGKSSVQPESPLIEDVKQADIRWAAAIRRAAEISAREREVLREYVDAFDANWHHWTPQGYEDSLCAFRKAGLPLTEMLEAIFIVDAARGVDSRFRYFCGVCWNKISALQDIAKALLAAEEGDK